MAMNTQGERLKWARERAGHEKAARAARELGVPEVTYRAHEKAGQNGGRVFKAGSAKRYGKAFGVSWSWLLTGEGSPEPDLPPQSPDSGKVSLRNKDESLPADNEGVEDMYSRKAWDLLEEANALPPVWRAKLARMISATLQEGQDDTSHPQERAS